MTAASTAVGSMARRAARVGLTLVVPLACACVRPSGPPADPRQAAPPADSVTVALWRFDEVAGERCRDAGPLRITATAGPATRVGYGRFGNAREFTRSSDSFVYAPNDPALVTQGGFTVDAWVFVRAFGQYEDTPIAACWNEEPNHQSWLFGVVGRKLQPPDTDVPSPGFHEALVRNGLPGQLMFAFQPRDASQPRAFLSSQRLVLGRWTHVAVSFDGQVVRLFVDGSLDAQYAVGARVQPSAAPLLVGNYLDTRRLSRFSGELRIEPGGDDTPYYAFEGLIDELRISSSARESFPGTGVR